MSGFAPTLDDRQSITELGRTLNGFYEWGTA